MNKEEFLKLNEDEQATYLKACDDVQAQMKKMQEDTKGLKQMNMEDFEKQMKTIMEKHIKGMDKTDKKYFVFPGIGNAKDLLDDVSAQGKFAKTTKFLKALVSKDIKTCQELGSEAAKKSLGTNIGGEGGFLLPEEFQNEILRLEETFGVIRANSRIMPMSKETLKIPKAGTTQQSAHWIPQKGKINQTDPNFEQIILVANKLAALPVLSSEILDDPDIAIVNYLTELIAEAFAGEEDEQGFNGTGAPFIGLLNAIGMPTYALAGTAFITLSYTDLVTITGRLKPSALTTAKWYFHRTLVAQTQGLITTTGAPIFDIKSQELVGWPVQRVEKLPATNSANAQVNNTAFGLFGSLNKAYILGDRKAITMKISDQATVNSVNLFENDMSALRMIERIALASALPSSMIRIVS